MGQEILQSFLLLACEKDLTDVIDLKDATMNSGGLRDGFKEEKYDSPMTLYLQTFISR